MVPTLAQIRRRGRPLQPGGRQHTSCADTCCCCVQEVRSVTSVPHVLNTPACSKNTRLCVWSCEYHPFRSLVSDIMISTSVRHPFWTSQPCSSIFKLAVPGGRHSSHINNVLVCEGRGGERVLSKAGEVCHEPEVCMKGWEVQNITCFTCENICLELPYIKNLK